MEVLGYKYTNEQDAVNACKECSDYYGIPVHPDDITKKWVDYNIAELNTPVFWYITFDETLRVVLGDPEIFEVTEPNPFPTN